MRDVSLYEEPIREYSSSDEELELFHEYEDEFDEEVFGNEADHGYDCRCSRCREREELFELYTALEPDLLDEDLAVTNESYGLEEILWDDEVEGEVNRKSREYVRWVQESLNKIQKVKLAVDGRVGQKTRSAIRSFQQLALLPVDGIVGPRTEAALITFTATLPPSSTGAGSGLVPAVNTPLPRSGIGFVASKGKPQSRQYGLPETIQALKEIGRRWNALYPSGPPIQISDISRRGGGRFAPHASHRLGNDVDIRFIKKDGRLGAVNPLLPSQKPNFDKARTQHLVDIIQANGVLKVHRLWINKYIGLKKINGDTIHSDHMHVRFCVPARYDLPAMRRAAKVSSKGTYSTC